MALPIPKLTPEQYLAIERQAEHRSEYFDGEMFAMAGGSPAHSELAARLIGILLNRLAGPGCKVYTSDLRVRTEASGLYTYPDVTVVCGKPVFASDEHDVLTNPTVIFEVLSGSTEAKDRGFKFQQYKQIPTLREYVLVSQSEPLVERFRRAPGGAEWTGYSDAKGLDARLVLQPLSGVVVEIPLGEIYRDVEFQQSRL